MRLTHDSLRRPDRCNIQLYRRSWLICGYRTFLFRPKKWQGAVERALWGMPYLRICACAFHRVQTLRVRGERFDDIGVRAPACFDDVRERDGVCINGRPRRSASSIRSKSSSIAFFSYMARVAAFATKLKQEHFGLGGDYMGIVFDNRKLCVGRLDVDSSKL